MNAEERVLKTLRHEEPDRVPGFESAFTNDTIMNHYGFKPGHLGSLLRPLYYIPFKNKLLRKTITKEKLVAQGIRNLVKFYRKIGLDLIPSVSSLFPRKVIKGGFIDEYGRIMKPEYYPKDNTEILGYHGGYFKSFEDFESWEHPDPNDPERIAGYLAGKRVQKEVNDEVFVIPSSGALMECTWEGFGLERFSRLLASKTKIEKVFKTRGEFTLELVKILSESGAKMILLYDDFGYKKGLFMSPRMYRKYIIPWYKKICAAAEKHDSIIMLHSCGDIMEIFKDLVDTGIKAFNPIEPTTANEEYNIFNLNKLYGDKITLVGNISPQMLSTGSYDEIEDYTKRLLKELGPGGGYIFASGHSINPAITLDRWQLAMQIFYKLRNYPI